jgi:hypothetical protein
MSRPRATPFTAFRRRDNDDETLDKKQPIFPAPSISALARRDAGGGQKEFGSSTRSLARSAWDNATPKSRPVGYGVIRAGVRRADSMIGVTKVRRKPSGILPWVQQFYSASLYMLNVSSDQRHSVVECSCGD